MNLVLSDWNRVEEGQGCVSKDGEGIFVGEMMILTSSLGDIAVVHIQTALDSGSSFGKI
jgi:hypothetical protein